MTADAAQLSRRALLERSAALAALIAIGELPTKARASESARAPRNRRVSRDTFTHHAEPFLAVNPRDPRNLLGACIAIPASGRSLLATYASFDGGATWQNNGALPDSQGGRDPTVAFDSAGRGYVCGNTTGVSLWRTADGGRTFDAPAIVTAEKSDHPWLAAGPAPGASGDSLHVVWSLDDNTKLGFSRSTDGGHSFEPARTIADAGGAVTAAPAITAGSDGVVCAIFGVWPKPSSKGKQRRREIVAPVRVVCSVDGGITFGRPPELGRAAAEWSLPGGANAIAIPTIAADPNRDALYAVFAQRPRGAAYSTIVVARSLDRGHTWSRPLRVTPARRGLFCFQPQIAIDSRGRVAISAFVLERGRVHVVITTSRQAPLRFTAPRRISDRPFNPARGSPPGGAKHGAWWIGDYQGLAASTAGTFHPFWNDTRTGRLQLFTATVGV
jgi:hypothetical protein